MCITVSYAWGCFSRNKPPTCTTWLCNFAVWNWLVCQPTWCSCSSTAFFQEADPLGSGRSPTDNAAGPSHFLYVAVWDKFVVLIIRPWKILIFIIVGQQWKYFKDENIPIYGEMHIYTTVIKTRTE